MLFSSWVFLVPVPTTEISTGNRPYPILHCAPGLTLDSSVELVSTIYNDLISKNAQTLGVIESWNHDLEGQEFKLDWNHIWANVA